MAAASVEDDDTLSAFEAAFKADSNLPTAIPGGLKAGRLVANDAAKLARPYGQMVCTQGPRPNEYIAPVQTGQGYHDYRKLTITVYGLKAECKAALGYLRSAFEWQPKGTTPMSVPNASLKRVMPLPGSPRLEIDEGSRAGEDYWRAVVEYEVWTVRTVP